MIAIDLTCLGKDEILNKNIVSGIGTWVCEILDGIISNNKQNKYILIINFYAKDFMKERFPGFKMVSIGGAISKLILKLTGKSTETFLKNYGFNTRAVNRISKIEKIWFPFAIPEIVYSCNKKK